MPTPDWIIKFYKFSVKSFAFISTIINREKENASLKQENVILKERLEGCEKEIERLNELISVFTDKNLLEEQDLADKLNSDLERYS